MDTWIWIVLVVVVAMVAVVMFAGRRVTQGVDPTQLLLDPQLVSYVRQLAEAGQKITAIKALREGTPGLSLAAAKTMVDRMVPKAT